MNFPPKVSTSALAKLLSVNERTITKLVEKKVLRREARGTFDTIESIAAFVAHRESIVAAEHGVGVYGKARAQLYLERAKTARIHREKLEGELLPRDEVLAMMTHTFTVIKTRLLGIGAKIASRLAVERTPGGCARLVHAEVYEALSELSTCEIYLQKKDAA
jgi:hypothetical protein